MRHPSGRPFARWAARAEFDGTVAWALGVRFWQLLAGPITALLIATRFTEAEQDYFYTLTGLLGLDALCRLGLSEALVALTSHAFASRTEPGDEGDQRLSGLIRFSARWALGSAAAFAVGVGLFGLWSLSDSPASATGDGEHLGAVVHWRGAWWTAALCTAGSVAVAPIFAVLTGCGRIGPVTRTQTLAAMAGNLGAWSLMLLDGSLWAAAAACAARLCVEGVLIARSWGVLRSEASGDAAGFRWREAVWPMQWRAAVQSSAAALAATGLTLVLFRSRDALGDGEAGRMGMSWSAALALQYGGLAWLGTRAPRLGAFAANGDRAGFERLFARVFLASWAAVFVGAVAGTGLVWGLATFEFALAERLLSPLSFAALVFGSVALHLPLGLAAGVRAWRQEAFVAPAVAMWGAVAVATWLLGPTHGAAGVAWGFLAAVAGVGVPLHVIQWIRWRSEHPNGDPASPIHSD